MVKVFNISITEGAMHKLNQYYKLADKEIGGVFEVEIKKNNIKIVDTLLIDQEVSGGDFKLDEEALSDFSKKIFTTCPEKMTKFKGWWHKHPISGWSTHDDSTFETLLNTFGGAIIGLVHQGTTEEDKILCRVDMQDDRGNVSFNTLDFEVIKEKINKKELNKFCKKEYKKKIKEKKFEVVTNISNPSKFHNNNYYGSWSEWDSWGYNKNIDTGGYKDNNNHQTDLLRNILKDGITEMIKGQLSIDKDALSNCRKLISCEHCAFSRYCNTILEEKDDKYAEVQFYDY